MASLGARLYSLVEGVTIAVDSIRANKVRAGLTILGIAVGVFVVVVISAAIHGINESVLPRISNPQDQLPSFSSDIRSPSNPCGTDFIRTIPVFGGTTRRSPWATSMPWPICPPRMR